MAHLMLKGGRVIDPTNGRDETADIAFADGKVSGVGRDLQHDGMARLWMLADSSSCRG